MTYENKWVPTILFTLGNIFVISNIIINQYYWILEVVGVAYIFIFACLVFISDNSTHNKYVKTTHTEDLREYLE